MAETPQRNLAVELVRVTEAAALAAAQYMGMGDKNMSDQAAVDAMRLMMGTLEMDGVIVIGEGEKDDAPMLYNGEKVGRGTDPKVDVAVDPIEGTTLLSLGRPNSIAVIALAERGSMWNPGPSLYMEKIVVDKRAKGVIDLTHSVTDNINHLAVALGRAVQELTLFVLDKPRHESLVKEIREVGARVSLQGDGDVVGALLAATSGSGIDMLIGTGGTPEAVIAAAAVKALGGDMQSRCNPQSEDEKKSVVEYLGDSWNKLLGLDELIQSDEAFFAATGITDGPLLEGVRYDQVGGVTTHSMVMRAKTGTVRFIKAIHQFEKLMKISQIDYRNREHGSITPIDIAKA